MKYPLSYYLNKVHSRSVFTYNRILNRIFERQQSFKLLSNNRFYIHFFTAINDACEYLNITLDEFAAYIDDHNRWPEELWNNVSGNVEDFNKSIVGEFNKKNICANTICSFSAKYTHDVLYSVLTELRHKNENITLCDYGCCNANISITMLVDKLVSDLTLYDIYSESANFVKFRINKYGLNDSARWCDIANQTEDNPVFDVVYCMDVLEHTEKPSYILKSLIYPMTHLDVSGVWIKL